MIGKIKKWYNNWRIKLENNRTDIPDDEFDNSLDMNIDLMMKMSPEQKDKYLNNLVMRRSRAHNGEGIQWLDIT